MKKENEAIMTEEIEEGAVMESAEMEQTEAPVVGEDDVDVLEDNVAGDAVAPLEAPLDEAESDADEDAPAADAAAGRRPRRSRAVPQRIIEGDSDIALTALTPEQSREQNWRAIKQAMERRSILERQIIGVEPAGEAHNTPMVHVLVNDFKVVISTREFFDANLFSTDLTKVSEADRNRREFQMASRMMGAYVPFVITHAQSEIDPATGERVYGVRASRKEAMRRKRNNYYLGQTPRINVGDKVKARVLMSAPKGILMEVVGQEVVVPVHELSSCKWVDPLYDYAPGTVTYVVVTKLEVNREDKTVDLAVSRRPLDADEAKRAYDSVREGIRYIGTVVSVDQKYVRINLDCHVRASTQVIGLNGARLHYGDRVSVGVTGKNDRMRTVYGTCLPIATRTF